MFTRNIPNAGISHAVPIGDSYCRAFNFPACLSRSAYERTADVHNAGKRQRIKFPGILFLAFPFVSPLVSFSFCCWCSP